MKKGIICKLVLETLLFCGGFFCTGCASTGVSSDEVVYTKNNTHYYRSGEKNMGCVVHYTDNKTHGFLPCNTKVSLKSYGAGYYIKPLDGGDPVRFKYPPKWGGAISMKEYIALTTLPNATSYSHLSEIDQKGIKKGIAYKGMSKEGVVVALGYPAQTYTESLKSDKWRYWRNRFSKRIITFENNIVVDINPLKMY